MGQDCTSPKHTQRAARTCGECNVCCTAMHVAALEKPPGMRCQHMSDIGCSIYEQRPAACRDWYCMWVRDTRGVFSDQERPDRTGVFLTASKPTETGQQVIYVHPVRPDALELPATQAMITRLQQFVAMETLPYFGDSTELTLEGNRMPNAHHVPSASAA